VFNLQWDDIPWSQTKHRQNIQKADDLLVVLEKNSDPHLAPDYFHFTAVINGWLGVNDVDGAARVLIRCVEAYINK
jgi:hypothetical protein